MSPKIVVLVNWRASIATPNNLRNPIQEGIYPELRQE